MIRIAQISTIEDARFLCRIPANLEVGVGSEVLVELEHGRDLVKVLRVLNPSELDEGERNPRYRVVRLREPGDEEQLAKNRKQAERAKRSFAKLIMHEREAIKLVNVRFSYSRDMLFIRYTAHSPVDLRRFTGQMQRDYKTRVDLWQLGPRDEFALLGGVGPCGRGVCCATWQREFESVNVRMARAQDVAISSATLNGACGHLKCCMRFEYDHYVQAGAGLPPVGCRVKFGERGECCGTVVGRNILREGLVVKVESGNYVSVASRDVEIVRDWHAAESREGGE